MSHTALRRSQVYRFLADALLYPRDNWLADVPLLDEVLRDLNIAEGVVGELAIEEWNLETLQAEHRRVFGLAGSLCYETEYGLPHEFRQSQELADISGFYRAFGFTVGGTVRERPDHVAMELEFMHILALKEAYAAGEDATEYVEICADAQRQFIEDHLGQWIGLFADSVALNAQQGLFLNLARFAANFIQAEAERLGARITPRRLSEVRHTPMEEDYSCGDCPVAEMGDMPSAQGIAP